MFFFIFYTDYLLGGVLTLRNGRIDKLQFEEGNCQAAAYSRNASLEYLRLPLPQGNLSISTHSILHSP